MFITKKSKLFKRGLVKFGLAAAILSLTLVFAVSQVKAADSGWWNTVNQGGLDKVGQAYGQSGTPGADYDIRIMAARLIRRVLELLGIIFLILIIISGFRWMTAGGDEEKVAVSRKQLTNAVIGLVIIFISFAIATYIFYQLQYATTGIQPVTWSW